MQIPVNNGIMYVTTLLNNFFKSDEKYDTIITHTCKSKYTVINTYSFRR